MQIYKFRDSVKVGDQHGTVEIPLSEVPDTIERLRGVYKLHLIQICAKGAEKFGEGRVLEIFIEGLQDKTVEELEELARVQAIHLQIADDDNFNPSKH